MVDPVSKPPVSDALPTVSVVMATFNGAKYVRKQLASLLYQRRLPDELIVNDDCSSDETVAIVESFARTAPFPISISVNDRTIGYARNFIAAAGRCSGDLIMFADQDDIWLQDKIETLAGIAATQPEPVLSHDLSIVIEGTSTPKHPSYYRYLAEQGFPPAVCFKGCSLAIKSDFVTLWGWPPETSTISHDFWIALLSCAFGQRRYCDQVLVQHRLHGSNASGWIASQADRVRSSPLGGHPPGGHPLGDPAQTPSDLELLIELCIKSWRADRVGAFREAIDRAGSAVDPDLAETLLSGLEQNRSWYADRTRGT